MSTFVRLGRQSAVAQILTESVEPSRTIATGQKIENGENALDWAKRPALLRSMNPEQVVGRVLNVAAERPNKVEEEASEYVSLRDVAQRLLIKPHRLAQMSRQGSFPSLVRVSQKHYLVRRVDFDAWMESRKTTTDEVRAAAAAPRKAKRTAPAKRRKAVAR